jgi:hypothetical protein
MKIQYFDNYVIGIKFKSGYRMTFNKDELSVGLYHFINFLANNFGEPVTENNILHSENYALFDKQNEFVLVLKTEEQLNQVTDFLNMKSDIDYQSLSTYNKLVEKLSPFLFEKITQKNKNRIREIVRQILYVKPYDFILNLSDKGIFIKTDEDEWIIGT